MSGLEKKYLLCTCSFLCESCFLHNQAIKYVFSYTLPPTTVTGYVLSFDGNGSPHPSPPPPQAFNSGPYPPSLLSNHLLHTFYLLWVVCILVHVHVCAHLHCICVYMREERERGKQSVCLYGDICVSVKGRVCVCACVSMR